MGGVKYVQQDHQGSVRTITNASGLVVSRTDHQAFGEAIGAGVGLRNVNQGYGNDASTRQSYGLTEKDDSSGQQHTWFRKLETQAGRFSSPDPYKGSMSLADPQSFNRYSYVNNQPTNFVDPSGLAANICHAEADGTYWCTGGWGSGGGSRMSSQMLGALGINHYDASHDYQTAQALLNGGSGSIRITTFGRLLGEAANGQGIWQYIHFVSFSFATSFGGFSGFGGRGGGLGLEAGQGARSDEQTRYNNCIRNAWRRFRTRYAKNGAKTIVGSILLVAPVVAARYSGGAETAAHVGATVGRPAMPVGIILIGEAVNDGEEADLNKDIEKCKRESPNASHHTWDPWPL